MNSSNYNSLIKIASPIARGTRVPAPQSPYQKRSFVGGPSSSIVNKLHSYGLPMTPASSGVNPQRLSEAETQTQRIQNAERQNQIGKERNRQNLDAHFARLTALNDANKAAGRPAYNTTWQDLYAPYASSPVENRQAYGRQWKDSVLSSTAAYAGKVKGTPYNPAELRSLSAYIPNDIRIRDSRQEAAFDNNLNARNRWMYSTFGSKSLTPQFNSTRANYGRKVPAVRLSDFDSTKAKVNQQQSAIYPFK